MQKYYKLGMGETFTMTTLAPNPADPTTHVLQQVQTAQSRGNRPNIRDILGHCIDALLINFRKGGSDLIHNEDRFFKYASTLGIWQVSDIVDIKTDIDEWFRSAINIVPTKQFRSEVLEGLMMKVHKANVPWGNVRNIIICKNLIAYDLDKGQTVTVKKEWYLREDNLLNVDWVAGTSCPIWDKALTKLFAHIEDPSERTQVITLVEEWMGTTLYRHNRPRALSKCLFLYGERRTGKSTILDVPRQIFGEKLATAIDLQELSGFGAEALMNKAVWLSDEIKVGTVMNDSVIKRVITNEPLSIKVKFEKPFEGRLNLTVGLAGNSLPKIDDTSDAVYDRMIFVPMDTVIDASDENQKLKDQLASELPAILRRMVDRLADIRRRGQFKIPIGLLNKQEEIKLEQDPLRGFLMEAITPTNNLCAIKNGDIVSGYRGYLLKQFGQDQARNSKVYAVWLSRRISEAFPKSSVGRVDRGTVRARFGLHFSDKGKAWLSAGWGLEDSFYKPDQKKLKEANINTGVT